jgi:WD40 repeat protein
MVCKIETKRMPCALVVAFSNDGSLLAIGGGIAAGNGVDPEKDGGNLEIWDWRRNALIQTLKRHEKWIRCVAFGKDDRTLVSCGHDGVRVWDIKTGRHKFHLQDPGEESYSSVSSVAFMPDGRTFMSLHTKEPARFWDAETGKSVDPAKLKFSN